MAEVHDLSVAYPHGQRQVMASPDIQSDDQLIPSGLLSCRRASAFSMVQVASAATCAARLVSTARYLPSHNSRSLAETAAAARSVPATCIKIQRHGSDSLKTWASASPVPCQNSHNVS